MVASKSLVLVAGEEADGTAKETMGHDDFCVSNEGVLRLF